MWHHIVENHLLQRRNALLEEQPGKWLALKTVSTRPGTSSCRAAASDKGSIAAICGRLSKDFAVKIIPVKKDEQSLVYS